MTEMGLESQLVILPFPPRHKAKEYLKLNPLGTLPLLVDGALRMTESAAIAHYLCTRYGPSPLAVSAEEEDYGPFIDFLHHADATLTFPQTVYLRYCVQERERGLAAAGELYASWFIARLVKVEQRLLDREYLCAGRFTAADIAITYALLLARLIGLGDRMPARINDYLDRMTRREGFRLTQEKEQQAARAANIDTSS